LLLLAAVLQWQQAIWNAATNLDNAIGVQCAWSAPPSHYRDDKTLFIVDFQGVPITGMNSNQQVAGPMSFRRSSDAFKPSEHYGNYWYRCDITNYSAQAMRNFRAKFPVLFAEAEATENGARSGKVIASGYALTPSFDLAAGASDHFYFANASAVFIQISIPSSAILQTMTGDEWRTVKLVPPSRGKEVFALMPSPKPLHPVNAAAQSAH
jgi:hypothetical protein